MIPDCNFCGKIIPGAVKIHSYRKKIGKISKNVVEYYCEECFETVEKERSWDVHNEKESILKKQAIRRLQRRQNKVR